jgi:hypothetical protein
MRILLATLSSLFVGLALGFAIGRWAAWTPFDPGDDRLLGTWQSDGERTMNVIRETRKLDDEKLAMVERGMGKLEITYTNGRCVPVYAGKPQPEWGYRVLGKDRKSVVIEEDGAHNTDFADSTFSVIHFEGRNSYWLYMPGGFREYFTRVR